MAIGIYMIIGLALLFVVILVFGYAIGIYNSLIRLKNNIKKAWSNIEVLLKQRADELPKLINTVKGYMKHEQGVLENITKARSAMMSATTMKEKAKADNVLTGALKTLFAVAENYPTLKANENFMQLQGRITGIENELADRREFYNDSTNTYNIKIQSFPDMIIARMFGHTVPQEMFKATGEDKKDVKVEF
jgi:LemA protein